MAKINWQDIGELTNVDASSIGKAIIVPAKEALRQLRFAVGGNLTIRDNMYAAIVTLGYSGNSTQTLTNGVEYTFQNPLKTKPVGFTPISAVDSNGTAVDMPNCKINTSRTDGLIGITAKYDLPVGEMLTLVKTSNQAIATSTITPITFVEGTNLNDSKGSAMSFNGTDGIVIDEPGLYRLTGECVFAASAAGTIRTGSIRINSASVAVVSLPPITGSNLFLNASVDVAFNASAVGQVIKLNAFQDTGANLNALGAGTSASRTMGGFERCFLQATRVRNDEEPSYNVTGILWGG